jgi:hypothetical protein
MIQEQLDDLDVTLLSSPVQWRESVRICLVDVNAALAEERSDPIDISCSRCLPDRTGSSA